MGTSASQPVKQTPFVESISLAINNNSDSIALPQSPSNTSSTTERDWIELQSKVLGGAASGAVASVFCAPLDLIRTRLQVWGELRSSQGTISVIPQLLRETIAQEGWQGCFRGLGATLVTVPFFWGLYCEYKK